MRRLYAGSVSYDATEKDLRELFEPFGLVTCLTLVTGSKFLKNFLGCSTFQNLGTKT
jgi:RNA recognition motif-containing protein